jgi:hypothetical protein
MVVVNESRATDLTDSNGQFTFFGLPSGTYSITLTLGTNVTTIPNVQVAAGATVTLDETLDWEVRFTDTLIVRGASRRLERIIEAPAAAILVTETEIERKALSGQVPKLIAFTPGAQVTQGGLWDFNLGTRGFNRALRSLQRRARARAERRAVRGQYVGRGDQYDLEGASLQSGRDGTPRLRPA